LPALHPGKLTLAIAPENSVTILRVSSEAVPIDVETECAAREPMMADFIRPSDNHGMVGVQAIGSAESPASSICGTC